MTRLIRILRFFTLFLLLALPAQARTALTLTEGEGRAFNLPEGAANVFVADPMVADVQASSPTSIYITGVSQGRTNIIVRDMQDQTMIDFAVTVRRGTGRVQSLLGPGLSMDDQGDAVVISGQAQDVGAARSANTVRQTLEAQGTTVIDKSTYGGPNQVSLRVRFVEASRSDLRRIGVDLSALGRSAGGPIRIVTGLGNPTGFLDGGAASGPAIGGRATAGSFTIDGLIDALESRGAVQILSEPTLTTVSGQTASFRAGGEFAYPVNQGNGVISAAFKEYGVSIDFTPTILDKNRIAIHVRPEVSFVDKTNSVSVSGFQVPGVSVRSADTIVEVGSGQTFAIAGLYEQFSDSSGSGVPGLTRLLGHNSHIRNERELMIFITPYLAGAKDAAHPRRARPAPQRSVGFITR